MIIGIQQQKSVPTMSAILLANLICALIFVLCAVCMWERISEADRWTVMKIMT